MAHLDEGGEVGRNRAAKSRPELHLMASGREERQPSARVHAARIGQVRKPKSSRRHDFAS